MDQQFETVSSEPAAADLTGSQWCAVGLNSSNNVALCGAGLMPVGILQNPDAKQGAQARYAWQGRLKAKYGGTIAVGAEVAVGANGTFVTAASGNAICGVAQVAGGSGFIGRIVYGFRGIKP